MEFLGLGDFEKSRRSCSLGNSRKSVVDSIPDELEAHLELPDRADQHDTNSDVKRVV